MILLLSDESLSGGNFSSVRILTWTCSQFQTKSLLSISYSLCFWSLVVSPISHFLWRFLVFLFRVSSSCLFSFAFLWIGKKIWVRYSGFCSIVLMLFIWFPINDFIGLLWLFIFTICPENKITVSYSASSVFRIWDLFVSLRLCVQILLQFWDCVLRVLVVKCA